MGVSNKHIKTTVFSRRWLCLTSWPDNYGPQSGCNSHAIDFSFVVINLVQKTGLSGTFAGAKGERARGFRHWHCY